MFGRMFVFGGCLYLGGVCIWGVFVFEGMFVFGGCLCLRGCLYLGDVCI